MIRTRRSASPLTSVGYPWTVKSAIQPLATAPIAGPWMTRSRLWRTSIWLNKSWNCHKSCNGVDALKVAMQSQVFRALVDERWES